MTIDMYILVWVSSGGSMIIPEVNHTHASLMSSPSRLKQVQITVVKVSQVKQVKLFKFFIISIPQNNGLSFLYSFSATTGCTT